MEAGLPIDYDHATDFAAPSGRPAPAAGWIREIEVRDGALWGRVEWTSHGRAAVVTHEYRYISPVFEYSQDGEVQRLLRAALTNNPNLYLTAISARAARGESVFPRRCQRISKRGPRKIARNKQRVRTDGLESQLRDILGLEEASRIPDENRGGSQQSDRGASARQCSGRTSRPAALRSCSRRLAEAIGGSGAVRTDRAIRKHTDGVEPVARGERSRASRLSGGCGDEGGQDRAGAARVGDRILPGEPERLRGIHRAPAGDGRGSDSELRGRTCRRARHGIGDRRSTQGLESRSAGAIA